MLRPLEASDLDALLAVQQEGAVVGLGHIFPQQQYPFPAASVRARWEAELADPGIDCFVVLDQAGRIAGFAATQAEQFLHFGTAVATWGSGLAGVAHDEVLEHLRSGGHAVAWLHVFEANVRARRFYERCGWKRRGVNTRSGFAPYPVLIDYEISLVNASVGSL